MSDYDRERESDRCKSAVSIETPKVDDGSKYRKLIKGVELDVYDVLVAFDITNPGLQHALKKLLLTGGRGYKNFDEDADEAIVSINRAKELEIN